jgi:hypothetical protein
MRDGAQLERLGKLKKKKKSVISWGLEPTAFQLVA